MKKQIGSILLLICLIFSLAVTVSGAEADSIGDLTWTVRDNVLTISGNGPMETSYSNVPWKSYSSTVTSIVVEHGVTSIGTYAFNGFRQVTSVSLPDTLTAIDSNAFNGCYRLPSITIPYGVQSIGDNAFDGCSYLSAISIPGSVKTIGNYAFDNGNLTSVTFSEGLESIGACAFYGCDDLVTVTLPASLKTLGNYVFQYCDSLTAVQVAAGSASYTSVDGVLYTKDMRQLVLCPPAYPASTLTVPSGVTTIAPRSMKKCRFLTSVILPDTVTSIGNGVFEECTALTSVNIPSGVTVLEDALFSGCTELAITWDVLKNVTRIGSHTFFNCGKITGEFSLRADVTSLGTHAFHGCTGITGHVQLPVAVTNVPTGIFYGCNGITGVTIPDSVTSIGHYAFEACTGITTLTLPATVSYLGEAVFRGCTGLTEAVIPDSVTILPYYTFDGCTALTSVTLPRQLQTIQPYYDGSFTAFQGCSRLTDVIFRSAPPADLAGKEAQVFSGHGKDLTISYPTSAQAAWTAGAWDAHYTVKPYELTGQVASGTWGENLTWSVDANGTMTISGEGDMANGNPSKGTSWASEKSFVTKIVVEEGVTSLGQYAFLDFTSLKTMILPEGMTTISNHAMDGCTALETITIPHTVTTLGSVHYTYGIFDDCPAVAILGHGRSYAQAYAEEKGHFFSATLGNTPVQTVTIYPAGADRTHAQVEQELRDALKDHTRIILKDGLYKLNRSLTIAGLIDVTIQAENPGGAELLLSSGYDPVVLVQAQYPKPDPVFIDLNGLILGHATGAGFTEGCDGSSYSNGHVVLLSEASHVTIDRCDLWGCGIYAVYMTNSSDVTVQNSILRDCVYSAVYASNSQADFIGCIISGNAYRENYRTYPCIQIYVTSALTFTDCQFLNNYNRIFMTRNLGLTEEHFVNCTYQDNTWQGLTPKTYGVCLGGAVWQAVENEAGTYDLILCQDLTHADGTVLANAGNEIPAYSKSSLPWGKLTIADRTLAPGTTLRLLPQEAKSTVCVSYEAIKPAADTPYYFSYVLYDANGKMLDVGWNCVVFSETALAEFQLEAQKAGTICKILLMSGDGLTPQADVTQLIFAE